MKSYTLNQHISYVVTTFAVVWIEILLIHRAAQCQGVTTFAVVWIEISVSSTFAL
nr:hypothetical protein [Eisenbergiella sp.]